MIGCKEGENFIIPDMETMKNECGESRLWGGMHFRKSVSASFSLCEGLGDLAWDTVNKVRNGSNFTSTYVQGDPLPSRNAPGANCSASSTMLPATEPPTGNNTEAPTTVAVPIKNEDANPEDQDDLNGQASVAFPQQTGFAFLCLVASLVTWLK